MVNRRRTFKILFSIPKTIWFNLRYLPFRQAIKLPIWVAGNVRIRELHRGCMRLQGTLRMGMIRIGYHETDGVDFYGVHTIINVDKSGTIEFKNDAHIGTGAIIRVKKEGTISFGDNFAISGTTSIIASKSIRFGDEVQLSWNSHIMDSDAHKIYDTEGKWINPPCEIIVGSHVWIASNTTIMKGSVIQDNTVVASNSLVNKAFTEGNCVLAGQPAKIIKRIGRFII